MSDAYLNPVPGAYDPRTHGSPVLFSLVKWAQALATGDQLAASEAGNALLKAASREHMSQLAMDELYGAMVKAVHAVQPPPPAADASKAGAEGIDWYEPDPKRFYVLDKKSGLELNDVLQDLRYMDRYLRRGARAPSRLLFIGDAGNGKTAGALWLGSQLNKRVALVRIDGTIGSMVGETSKRLRASCEAAVQEDAVIVIDEFEAIAVSRGATGPNVGQWHKETTSALLQLLDSLPPTQIVIGATNVPGAIDSAVLRRLRKHVFFHPPDRTARAAMLDRWWKTAPHERAAKKVLLDLTEGQSGDFLERAAEEANRAAARRTGDAEISVNEVNAAVLSTMAVAMALTAEQATQVKVAIQERFSAAPPSPLPSSETPVEVP